MWPRIRIMNNFHDCSIFLSIKRVYKPNKAIMIMFIVLVICWISCQKYYTSRHLQMRESYNRCNKLRSKDLSPVTRHNFMRFKFDNGMERGYLYKVITNILIHVSVCHYSTSYIYKEAVIWKQILRTCSELVIMHIKFFLTLCTWLLHVLDMTRTYLKYKNQEHMNNVQDVN